MSELPSLDNPDIEIRHGLPHYGGGRGVFATARIRTGTVVLSEDPVFCGPAAAEVRAR